MVRSSWWALLLGFLLTSAGGLQTKLSAEDVKGSEKKGETKLFEDLNPLLKAYAREPNKAACKDCCPRPKATVTVTETGNITVTCTHTRSSDRTQLTTVRFTSTVTSLNRRTERVIFVNTTSVVVSRQVTFFETTEAARYRIFTKTQTVFTSFAIATVIKTTRIPSTRLISTLVFTTTTSTISTTVTSQSVIFSTLFSTFVVDAVTLVITTVPFDFTSTFTSTTVDLVQTTLPNSPLSFFVTLTTTTASFLTTSFFLGTQTTDLRTSFDIIIVAPSITTTFQITTNTANVVEYTTGATTLTFSELYPLPIIT